MASYLSPGVYVEEVSSGTHPIAGVSTSTAGFIGCFKACMMLDVVTTPNADNKTKVFNFTKSAIPGPGQEFPVDISEGGFSVKIGEVDVIGGVELNSNNVTFTDPPESDPIEISYSYEDGGKEKPVTDTFNADNQTVKFGLSQTPKDPKKLVVKVGNIKKKIDKDFSVSGKNVTFTKAPESPVVKVSYCANMENEGFSVIYPEVTETLKIKGDGVKTQFLLGNSPVLTSSDSFSVSFTGGGDTGDTSLVNDQPQAGQSALKFTTPPGEGKEIVVSYHPAFKPVESGTVKLCTNFSQFKGYFGDFSLCPQHNNLVHGVYGFFNNGGTTCYVAWEDEESKVEEILTRFEAIDDISIICAPGMQSLDVYNKIVTHCQTKTQSCFAVLDTKEKVDQITDLTDFGQDGVPPKSDYAAVYYPWIQVMNPADNRKIYIPPSGHMAGVYANVDSTRGVYKAPANVTINGVLGLQYKISKAEQALLNPEGVNCIRNLNNQNLVWGARTIGGDSQGEWKYINVRRLFIYLKKSIDEGTQWVVFEPNDRSLWAKITRNITAFLTTVWQSGALFGSTAKEAFYVKCDDETNPPEVRDLGQVITEIGVAPVKPAEFVIFRISQWAGPNAT